MTLGGGSPTFIRELCLATAHRWEPDRLYVLYTAYFDESNKGVKKPNLTLAAWLATARQWELFERRIKGMQRDYGFKIFHATDCRAHHGEFLGWSDDKETRLVTELAEAINLGLTKALTLTFPYALYESEYLKGIPFPKGMRKDSQYGFAFRVCLHQLIKLISADKKRHRLHVIVEIGAPGDVVSIFDEIKSEYAAIGYDVLGMLTIASKIDPNGLPLMVADFQAHIGMLNDRLRRDGLPIYTEMTDAAPKKNRAAITFMEMTPELLRQTKINWQKEKDERAAQWRARRDAKKS